MTATPGHPLTLGGAELRLLPSGGLWWPDRRLYAAGDLHLGRSLRLARRGGTLLPPYETEETLARLDADIAALDPARVLCLGDSFDDDAAAGELGERHALWLARLAAGRGWVWIAGNHDPGLAALPGSLRAEWREGGVAFRHIAQAAETGPEVSAHVHAAVRLAGRSRPAFVTDGRRLILPAFGAYTGSLPADHADILAMMGTGARAVTAGPRALTVPLRPGPAARPARPPFARNGP